MISVFDDLPTSTQVNITGTVEQVMAYINTTFPDYAWPDVEDLDTTTSNFSAVDNTVYCNVGKQGSYYTATKVMKHLRHFGRHILKVGGGPAACAQASCRRRESATTTPVAFWFCNDVGESLEAVTNTRFMRLLAFQCLSLYCSNRTCKQLLPPSTKSPILGRWSSNSVSSSVHQFPGSEDRLFTHRSLGMSSSLLRIAVRSS